MYPRVDDNAAIILNYKDGLAILEASWDLPPAPRHGNEIYGMRGSIVGTQLRKAGTPGGGRGSSQGEAITVDPLPPERAAPLDYMVSRIRSKQPLDGPSALDLNVAVLEVLDAAKLAARLGRAVRLPAESHGSAPPSE
jgi:predicted dehydrogenase